MASSPEDNKAVSNYRVIARKYRPHSFDDLIGQEPMVRTLSNAFETGRIAQAYMLTGVRGVGKTTTARILARALNYKTSTVDRPSVEMSQMGENCQAIMDGNHLDIIEMDAASHTGIDDIRDIIESGQYKPSSARYKVYIIDEVHMLSRNAFNGLLKTLEEPPEHLKFIFATTEIRKVPVTILSRCQRFDLRRISSDVMASHLTSISEKEGVQIDADALAMIVRAAEGSVRDAQSLLDQAIAHSAHSNDDSDIINIAGDSVQAMLGLADRMRVIDLFEHLMKGDIAASLGELRDQFDVGAEPGVVLSDLADFVHFVTRLKYVPGAAEDPAISESEGKRGLEFATALSVRTLGRAWQILLKGIEEVNASERPLMAADMVLVRLAHAANLPSLDEVIRSVEKGAMANPVTVGGNNQQVAGNAPAGNPAANITPGSGTSMSVGASPSAPSAPRMTASGRSHLAIVPDSPQLQPAIGEPQPVILNTFEELIFLAEDKRDLSVKTGLRRNIRLVSFEDGRMECSLTGNPRPDFINDLHQKLKLWTGKRWNIAVSREPGAPTLEEVERAEEASKLDMASADPVVGAILAKFPGSKVIDVRIRENEISHTELPETTDGLDEFFD